MSPDVVALGEPMIEFNALSSGRLKDALGFHKSWGGDTSNYVIAVSRLKHSSGYMSRIGDDEFGKSFLDLWTREGVDYSQTIIEAGGFTGIYFISIKANGEHDFTYYRSNSPASHFSIQDLNPSYIEGAKILHTSGISQAISSQTREAVFHAIQIARQAGVTVSYDPNLRQQLWPPNMARAIILHSFELADVVLPSIEDLRCLWGAISLETATRDILRRGPKLVVVKLGAEGCLIGSGETLIKVPGLPVTPVDTTGAGDAFDGAVAVGLLEEQSIEEIARFANTVGALTTLGKGAVEPIPHRKDVDTFQKSQKSRRS